MTKKHFIDFANEISNMNSRTEAQAAANVVIAVATRHNPFFNASGFLEACGL